jgi:hypothetical protein
LQGFQRIFGTEEQPKINQNHPRLYGCFYENGAESAEMVI